jgi:hypothetical protein
MAASSLLLFFALDILSLFVWMATAGSQQDGIYALARKKLFFN